MQPRIFARLARRALRVPLRRWTGSQPPGARGWSLRFEILTDGVRESMRMAAQLPVHERRALFESLAPGGPSRGVRREEVSANGVPATWFVPAGAEASPVVLFLHGGAYQFGSVKIYRDWLVRLALGARRRVLAIDYRLAPEHPFPAAREDALRALRFLDEKGHVVVLAGDSAGGNLALTTLLAVRDARAGAPGADAEARGLRMPARAALVCPWLDLAYARPSRRANDGVDTILNETADTWATDYLAGHDPRDPRISPIYADLRGLPPLLVQGGTRELLHDEIVELDEKARAAGVDVTLSMYEGMTHDWHVLASFGVEESRVAIAEMARFLAG